MMNTIERARGRWREILPLLGIDAQFLSGRHGPCPLCGGRDRFRFDDRNGEGTYYCNQCGAGVGVLLVRKKHGWNHREACDEIDRIIGAGGPAAAPRPVEKSAANREAAIRRALDAATSSSVVDAYLTRRGLSVRSPVLRGDPRCPYFDSEGKRIGRYPAVLAPIIGPDGTLQSVARIYDTDVEPRKKIMPPVSTIKGAAVRLFEPDEELAIGEGIETCLAVRELFGVPTWAALSAPGIEAFEPPPGLLRLHIYADHDANATGQRAAYILAHRLSRTGLTVQVHIPAEADTDWLDVLNARRPA
jgi:putative DNA primase/helicase